MDHETFIKDETVVYDKGNLHEQEVRYINDFMYNGERWFNVELQNGGFMETKLITKKQ